MFATEQLHSSGLFYTKGKHVNLFRKVRGSFDLFIFENEDEAAHLHAILNEGKYSKKLKDGNIIDVCTTNGFAHRYFRVEITGLGVEGMRIVEIQFKTLLG